VIVLEGEDHPLEGLGVHANAGYLIKMDFVILARRTGAADQAVPAGVTPATGAVIPSGAHQKLAPALRTQMMVGVTDGIVTDVANRRPEKLVEALPSQSLYVLHPTDSTMESRRRHKGIVPKGVRKRQTNPIRRCR
jgi:hypothetical protein